MDLSDALGGGGGGAGGWPGGNNQGGGAWPGSGQPNPNPTWPGNAGAGGAWPAGGGGGGGAWPSGGGQPGGGGGAWPSGGGQPGGGGGAWPSGPQPGGQPGWPAQPHQPTPPTQPGGGGGWPSPSPGPAHPSVPSVPSAPQQSLTIPYNHTLPNGVFNNLLITVAGTVKPGAKMFTINLSTSHDLAFHLNPRFNEYGKQVIVRNSEIGKKWGTEERELGRFPFVPGQVFELKILCTNDEFRVAANGSHLLGYKHRVRDLRSITRLGIFNDVVLSAVSLDTLH